MNEDTINLLKECNAGCKSATSSMEQILAYVENQKLRDLIKEYDNKHIKYGDECHELLNSADSEEKDPNKFAMAMATLGTDLKLTINSSVNKAAGLLIDGCNMGIKSLTEYLHQYKAADDNAKHMTKKLIHIEEEFMKELLEFL